MVILNLKKILLSYFLLKFSISFLLQDNFVLKDFDMNSQKLNFKEMNYDFKLDSYFEGFQQLFFKQYDNIDEFEYRFEVFKKNLQLYENFNKKGKQKFKMGINCFSDLSPKEFTKHYLMDKNFQEDLNRHIKNNVKKTKTRRLFQFSDDFFYQNWDKNFEEDHFHNLQFDESFDRAQNNNQNFIQDAKNSINKDTYNIQDYPQKINWVEKGIVTNIQHQLDCACCYAFSALAALESQIQIKLKESFDFSEQEILDCTDNYQNQGCKGGLPSFVFEYIRQNGILSEQKYKYTGIKNSCIKNEYQKKQYFPNLHYIELDNHVLSLIAALQYGPVAVSHSVTTNFVGYVEGIIDESACSEQEEIPNHSTLLVGYNLKHETPYFILKNSWGSEWGLKGFFHLKIGPLQKSNHGICLLARYKINSIPLLKVDNNQLFVQIIKNMKTKVMILIIFMLLPSFNDFSILQQNNISNKLINQKQNIANSSSSIISIDGVDKVDHQQNNDKKVFCNGNHDQAKDKIHQNQSCQEHDHHQSGEIYILYFVIASLLICAICREIKKLTSIPYTPLLLIVGIVLGCFFQHLDLLSQSVNLLLKINPHAIVLIFLPIIIFESAFGIEPFIFKKQLGQLLMLAGPGVVIAVVLSAVSMHSALQYGKEFSWWALLMFSAVVSSTDPVAVVSLLKELGTPSKFNILLEGESLLNDGVAIVLYAVFMNICKGQFEGILATTKNFLWLCFGGVFVGIVACLLTVIWIKKIARDDLLSTNLTFFACYAVFFVSEVYFQVSGVIAIVTLGVFMAKFGKVSINPESEHYFHSVWSYLHFLLESILFIITGIFIGKYFFKGFHTITYYDAGKMFAFFFLLLIARYIMVKTMQWPINKLGPRIDEKDVVVLTYGGMRGAVSLCLALMIAMDPSFSTRFREIVIFYTVSIIALSTFVNGLTIKTLMQKLRFKEKSAAVKKIKDGIEKQLIIETVKQKSKVMNKKFTALADWDKVLEVCGIKQDIQERKKYGEQVSLDKVLNEQETIIETRLRFYQLLKAQIWNSFENGSCSSSTIRMLLEVINLVQEESDRPIWIWECISNEFLRVKTITNLFLLQKIPFVGFFVQKILINRLLLNYEMLQTLVNGLQSIENTKNDLPINLQYVKKVFQELRMNLKNCELQLFNFIEMYPDLAKSIQEKNIARTLINTQKHLLDKFLHHGSISDEEHKTLRSKYENRFKKITLDNQQYEINEKDPLQIVSSIFKNLSKKHLQKIQSHRQILKFKKDDFIFKKGQALEGIFVLIKGVVQKTECYTQSFHGMGAIFSLDCILGQTGSTLYSLQAQKKVKVIFVPKQVIFDIMQEDSHFEEQVYKQASVEMFEQTRNSQFDIDTEKLMQILEKSRFVKLKKGEQIKIENGAYLFRGKLEMAQDNPQTFQDNIIIPENIETLECLEQCVMFLFSDLLQNDSVINAQANIRNSMMQRQTFLTLAQNEKDIDNLYQILEKKLLIN